MKTFADFKRALAVGSTWKGIHHLGTYTGRDPAGKAIYEPKDLPARKVTRQQSNGIAFEPMDGKGESWLYFGKASDWKIDGDTAQYFETDNDGKQQLLLTYTLVKSK